MEHYMVSKNCIHAQKEIILKQIIIILREEFFAICGTHEGRRLSWPIEATVHEKLR
jgi:hypothetical protein